MKTKSYHQTHFHILAANSQKLLVVSGRKNFRQQLTGKKKKMNIVHLTDIYIQLLAYNWLAPHNIIYQFNLAAAGPARARLAVPEVHYVYSCLMPPVKHHHHQYVPHLVTGSQVVQLA